MKIGLLTDTHLPNMIHSLDELGPTPSEFFSSMDLILHGGDLIHTEVLDWCERFAPVICSDGNNDAYEDPRSKEVQIIDVEGWTIGMVHSLGGEQRPLSELSRIFSRKVDIMVAGHTHQERLELREDVMIVNSGSITFPRHKELRLGTVGLLEISPTTVRGEIITLGNTPGRPNPGEEMSLTVHR